MTPLICHNILPQPTTPHVHPQVAERKAARKHNLAEVKDIALTQELVKQQQERDGLTDKLAREVEAQALKEGVKVSGAARHNTLATKGSFCTFG